MSEDILINVTPQETRVAVIEHGVTQELHIERASARGFVGNIYMGKVVRVLPGMQWALVDIGGERAAFLHVADIWGNRVNGEPGLPIERLLNEGQSLMVQVTKDPIGTKGARLSTQISIAGRLLVYLPQESHIGISQRIEDEEERVHLREKLQQLMPADEKGGDAVRHRPDMQRHHHRRRPCALAAPIGARCLCRTPDHGEGMVGGTVQRRVLLQGEPGFEHRGIGRWFLPGEGEVGAAAIFDRRHRVWPAQVPRCLQHRREAFEALARDFGHQRVAVAEMPVGSGGTDSGRACHFGEAEPRWAALGDQRQRRGDQRLAQVARGDRGRGAVP